MGPDVHQTPLAKGPPHHRSSFEMTGAWLIEAVGMGNTRHTPLAWGMFMNSRGQAHLGFCLPTGVVCLPGGTKLEREGVHGSQPRAQRGRRVCMDTSVRTAGHFVLSKPGSELNGKELIKLKIPEEA